jgi:lipoprotein-anchoring transpeptidase ErfK/SrfK
MGAAKGQNAEPFTGDPVFAPPGFNPVNGATVGVAKPIIINFQRPIANRPLAEQAIHISSSPAVPGTFYWTTDTQVRWRPYNFWPSGTQVHIDASGAQSNFRVGEALVATIDNKTHQMTITRNGKVEKTFPVSMGMPDGKHETKNGTYYVLEKFPDIIMDSSTYGLPINSRLGYKETINWATSISTDGIYLHALEDTVWAQGNTNVSHGCLNLSAENARWFYDFSQPGDVVEVRDTGGAPLELWQNGDWSVPWSQWLAGSAADPTAAQQVPALAVGDPPSLRKQEADEQPPR